jgi:hypothetical protein
LDRPSIVGGLTFVALGTLLLLDRAGVLDALPLVARGWPLVIVLAGIVEAAVPPRRPRVGVLLVLTGAIVLLWTTRVVGSLQFVGPAVLILVGVALLLRQRVGGGERGTQA